MTEKPNLIVDLTCAFALKIIEYTESLEEKRRYNMANQLFKSGTSIGANIKEAEETHYWLTLCEQAKTIRTQTHRFQSWDLSKK